MNKYELSPVAKKFLKQVQRYLPEQANVIVGVSGGADSMSLLYLLHRNNIHSTAVHCNYGLRGKASDKDQELVEKMCQLWGLDCVSVRLLPESKKNFNFQQWARDRRYEVFSDLKKETGAQFILTAHHQDDQLETIFQRILRGSGMASWSGMQAVERDLFRPLLPVSKKEIMEFVQDFNIPYRIDSTNEESTYARNFIRNNWFPDLNRLFPGWRDNLLGLPERADEFYQLAVSVAESVQTKPGNISRAKFLSHSIPVQRVLLHHILRADEFTADISKGFLHNIHQLAELQTGAGLTISETLSIIRDRDIFVIQDKKGGEKVKKEISLKHAEQGKQFDHVKLKIDDTPEHFKLSELCLDLDEIKFPVTIRNWKHGDRFTPFGMEGTQLISDHLTNRKIPSNKKKSAKVIESFDGNICAVIFPHNSGVDEIGTISNNVRCTDITKKSLIISKT